MFHRTLINWEEFKRTPCDDLFHNKMVAGLHNDKCKDFIYGYFDSDEKLVGACATKEYRNIANMKWIMSLQKRRGVFRQMMEDSVWDAYENDREYYRVSINPPALAAYQALGFKVWGEQKSGCFLSIGRLWGPFIHDIRWEWTDYVEREVTKKTMGGCVNEIYEVPR